MEGTMQHSQHILYYCSTVFQLFNVIHMRISLHADCVRADLVLDNATDFSEYIVSIRETGLFEQIYLFDFLTVSQKWRSLSLQQRQEASREPVQFCEFEIETKPYTDFYIANDWAVQKLFYYLLVAKGMLPDIHLYEDGTASYSLHISRRASEEAIDHKFYDKNSFQKRLVDFLLYEPQLFSGNAPCPILQLPKVNRENMQLQDIMRRLFGLNLLPPATYIFFEEASMEDKYPCNDFELFEGIAALVGKENIIVKRHPRNRIDRFSLAGYRVMENKTVPWEVLLLQNDLPDKILVTITSGATMTPHMVFGENIRAIHLVHMMQGNTPTTYHPEFYQFYEKLVELFNQEHTCVNRPRSFREFEEVYTYLEGCRRLKKWKADLNHA